MIKDILIGQYLYKDSFIHKLDPRTKIICSLIFMISVFSVKWLYEFFFAIIILLLIIYFSKIPFFRLFYGFKPILPLILLTIFMNLFFVEGDLIFSFFCIKITSEGLYLAIFMVFKIFFLVMSTSLLTLTTSPISLTDGIESLLKKFRFIKIPYHEIAMMMSIALRFIPTLANGADKIVKAQKARGADFEVKNILKKVKAIISVLIPLFFNAFIRAEELALAMESRCYRGDYHRTKFRQLHYKLEDIIILIFFSSLLIFLIMRNIYI